MIRLGHTIARGVYGSSRYAFSSLLSVTSNPAIHQHHLCSCRGATLRNSTSPRRTDELLHIVQAGSAHNRRRDKVIRQRPRQRHLSHGHALFLGQLFHALVDLLDGVIGLVVPACLVRARCQRMWAIGVRDGGERSTRTHVSEAVRLVPSLFHGRARKPRQRGDQGIMPAPKSC